MKYYLVGTPKPVFTSSLFLPLRKIEFTKEEIEVNLVMTANRRIFISLEDAREYARSLRASANSHLGTSSGKKIAPVVHIELIKNNENYDFTQQEQETEEVTVKEYVNFYHSHHNGEHKRTINFISTSKLENFDLRDLNITAVEFPDVDYPIIKFNQIALSFFRALNPTSNNSGIVYCQAGNNPCQGKEMLDSTLGNNISRAWKSDLDFLSGLSATFNILVGEHFDLYLKGRHNDQGGAKGVLDFLILPLIARKLIADTYLNRQNENTFTNVLAWAIAVPIEIARFSAGIALTLLVLPVVALVHLIKNCLPAQETIIESSSLII